MPVGKDGRERRDQKEYRDVGIINQKKEFLRPWNVSSRVNKRRSSSLQTLDTEKPMIDIFIVLATMPKHQVDQGRQSTSLPLNRERRTKNEDEWVKHLDGYTPPEMKGNTIRKGQCQRRAFYA